MKLVVGIDKEQGYDLKDTVIEHLKELWKREIHHALIEELTYGVGTPMFVEKDLGNFRNMCQDYILDPYTPKAEVTIDFVEVEVDFRIGDRVYTETFKDEEEKPEVEICACCGKAIDVD